MKKNIILYSFIALLSGTAGCSDMLDEYPLDAISPETYYNNADELLCKIYKSNARNYGNSFA